MQFEPWMEKATPDDMPNDDLKYVAEKAGMRYALMLIFLLAGLTVNIPKNSFKKLKEKYIIKEYDGTRFTLNRLAVECDISQRLVYKIIKKHLQQSNKHKVPKN